MKIYRLIIIPIVMLVFIFACEQDKFPLPVPKTTSTTFGASDTSYIELNPIWDAANLGYSFSDPYDIIMGPDGIIFVADEGNDRVVAMSRAGHVLTHSNLDKIRVPHPRGIAIDSKLNVLVTNGSDTLYCWNQYLNYIAIDSVAEQAVIYDAASGDTVHLTFQQIADLVASGQPVPQIRGLIFKSDPELVQEVRAVYPIYVDEDAGAQYNGVAAGPFGSEIIYVTESAIDKIIRLHLYPIMAVKTTDGIVLFHYRAYLEKNVATFGSGAGTVDDPMGITTDSDGNLYFTQLGGNFKVQKLSSLDYSPVYILYKHPIMDLNRFTAPYDISLDDAGDIFVMDTGAKRVFKFDNTGSGAGNVIDLGNKGLAIEEFNNGRGIMVQENVVYVVESGRNRIRRFQYSISESDIPDDEKKP